MTPHLIPSVLTLCLALCLVSPALAGRDDDDRRGRGGNPMDDMTPEQREKVREALEAVWDDPSVKEAREAMGAAASAFRQALREAISKTDPEIRDLLDEALRDKFRRGMRGHSGDRGAHPGLPRPEDVPEEFRDRLQTVTDAAARDPELKKLHEELWKTDRDDDEARHELFKRSFARLREVVEQEDAELLRFFPPPGGPHDTGKPDPPHQ